MLPKNWGGPMGAPAIFEKQIEIKLLYFASTLESRIQVNGKALYLDKVETPILQILIAGSMIRCVSTAIVSDK
ncbi:MAG: hypothetical protein P8X89_16415, partial [Reinekea sp.]